MGCIACFISDEHQSALKNECFNLDRFEDKLSKYKRLYIDEVDNLKSISKCDCKYKNTNHDYVKWTDDFFGELLNNKKIIENTFDELIEIYIDYISKSSKVAIYRLWKFLEEEGLLKDTEDGFSYSTLFYRARKRGKFDENDIKELFHISFADREKVGSQRFSISGQPMLYLAKSTIGLEKELSMPLKDLSIAAFLPFYKDFYERKYYTIKNSLFNNIVIALPKFQEDENPFDYYNCVLEPNCNSIKIDLKKSILSQILTFPIKDGVKNSFVPEYVLPQMLTTALLEHNYSGVAFPSTKDFSETNHYDISSDYNSNFAIFVDYSRKSLYDYKLLTYFLYFTFDGNEKMNYSVKDILDKIELISILHKESKIDMDFFIPLGNLNFHIEQMKSSKINNVNYFDTIYGKVELEFISKVADFYLSKRTDTNLLKYAGEKK